MTNRILGGKRSCGKKAKKKGTMRRLICILSAALLLPIISLAEEEYSMREIPVTEVGPVRIGQTENTEAAPGCTVVIAPE